MEPFRSVVLEGNHVRLEPLDESHFAALCEMGQDPSIFQWFTTSYHTPDKMRQAMQEAFDSRKKGTVQAFATIDKISKRVVGTTRFLNIDYFNCRLEIGHTWISPLWQNTHINTEAKFLMLRYAFEEKKANRVEFQTDSLNENSRKAILRLGAKEEGTLRNHKVTDSGRLRHSVVFSIIDSEWPQVKGELETKMKSHKV